MFVDIRKTKYCVVHIVDAGTQFFDCTILPKRSGPIMEIIMEVCWMLRHKAPKRVLADNKY